MSLFDSDSWDGNIATLPDDLRLKMEAASKPAAPTTEEVQRQDAEFDARVQKALNSRNIDAHLSTIKDRVSAENYEATATKFKKAVGSGGLSLDQASALFFPKGEDGADTLAPPPRDPAATGVGLPAPPVAAGGAWTDDKVTEQRAALRQMPMSKALKWRRDPANKGFLDAEMKSYSASSSL